MKVCSRCGQQLNDNEEFCNRCGGTKFKIPGQPRPQQRQNMNMNMNMNMGGMQGQNQQNMNMNMGGMQGQGQGQMQGQNQQNMNMQNMQMNMQQPSSKKLFKSRKEKKAEMEAEMAIMKQMKEQGLTGNPNQLNMQNQQRPMQQNKPMQQNQQQQYNMQKQQMNNQNQFTDNYSSDDEMSIQDWVILLVIMSVPVVNIVYILKNMNNYNISLTKRNFLKGYAAYFIVAIIISFMLSSVLIK